MIAVSNWFRVWDKVSPSVLEPEWCGCESRCASERMVSMGRAFASNIHFGPDCWEWMSAKNRKGYGQFRENGTLHIATRYAYALVNGPIPAGMQVCHKCDNPKCVRHDHLFLGDNSDNQRDSVAKGRHASTKKTHCTKGHEYSEENTLNESDGSRRCRTCNRARCAIYSERRVSNVAD